MASSRVSTAALCVALAAVGATLLAAASLLIPAEPFRHAWGGLAVLVSATAALLAIGALPLAIIAVVNSRRDDRPVQRAWAALIVTIVTLPTSGALAIVCLVCAFLASWRA